MFAIDQEQLDVAEQCDKTYNSNPKNPSRTLIEPQSENDRPSSPLPWKGLSDPQPNITTPKWYLGFRVSEF